MEGRQTAARARAELLLNESEKQGGCLAPASSADRRVLQRLCKDEIVEPVPGVFARRSRWQTLPVEERMLGVMRGLAERHPSWIFCGSSAALIHGLDVPYSLLHSIHVQAPGHAGRMPEHPVSFHSYRKVEAECVQGMMITPFWRTVCDCLLTAPFSEALAVADSAARLQGLDRDEFVSRVTKETIRRHGRAGALHTAEWVDPRAENGGESRVRAYLIENGYELPELQVELRDPVDRHRVYRVDFFWKIKRAGNKVDKVIGEFDGLGKYGRDGVLANGLEARKLIDERQRESHLTLLGFPVLRFTFHDLVAPGWLEHLLASVGLHPGARRSVDRPLKRRC